MHADLLPSLCQLLQASQVDLSTVCALGANAIAELELKDPNFERFASLFGPRAESINRRHQTVEENERLAARLKLFMLHLSPFLQLTAAHHALEWLIRRYEIHIFDVDAIMAMILPFHGTLIFVKLVQLLRLDSNKLFTWLELVKKSGRPLDRDSLVHRCHQDTALLDFICSTATQVVSLQPSPASCEHWITLMASIASGVIEKRCPRAVVQSLLPSLLLALKSSQTSLRTCGYTVLAVLASHARLEEDVKNALTIHLW